MRRDVKVEAPELRLDPEQVVAGVDWEHAFGAAGRVEVEIGIGKGRFLLDAATSHPDVFYLGVDWANQYLRIAEARALRRGLTNVRFARVDARQLVPAIPEASVSAFYVFYPDPWPKKRHHKRRFFRPDTIDGLARTLAPGGWLHAATDHEPYWDEIEALLDAHAAFRREPSFGGPEFPQSPDLPLTNFEDKYRLEARHRFRATWRRT